MTANTIRKTCLLPFLRGAGQMLFQPSAVTGCIFLLLIFSQSGPALAACLAGLLGATACAYVMEHPGEAYFRGEGGFNGGLLGLALAVFYAPGVSLLLLALAGGVLAAVVRVVLLRILPVPPFTAPFVLVAWPAFLGAGLLALDPLPLPSAGSGPVQALATNASQVLFMLHPWIGAGVFVAVLLHSRAAALWVGTASLIAWLTAVLSGLPEALTAAGLLGYNALILAAALQQRGTRRLFFAGGVAVSVWLSWVFFHTGITPLSAPFVLSAWLVIAAERILRSRRVTSQG